MYLVGVFVRKVKAVVTAFDSRLEKHEKIFKELINSTNIYMPDFSEPTLTKTGKELYRLNPTPEMIKVLRHNASIFPMPLIFLYLPSVYLRIFLRLALTSQNLETMATCKPQQVKATNLYQSLSDLDKPRFQEVLIFFIKSGLFDAVFEKDRQLYLRIGIPYCYYFCSLTLDDLSLIAKTAIVNRKVAVKGRGRAWTQWVDIQPIRITFDDVKGAEDDIYRINPEKPVVRKKEPHFTR